MKSALEERVKCEVPSRHPILAFLVEHAGRLTSRYQVGRDGRTAYDLHAGKLYRRQLVEFGERVYLYADSTWRRKTSEIGSQVARRSIHRYQRSQRRDADHDVQCTRREMFGGVQNRSGGTLSFSRRLKNNENDEKCSNKKPKRMNMCGQFVWISTEIANPSLVGCSIVSSLMNTTFVLTRALDAKHISDQRFIHSFACAVCSRAVHQSAFSSDLYIYIRLMVLTMTEHGSRQNTRRTLCSQTHMSHSRTW